MRVSTKLLKALLRLISGESVAATSLRDDFARDLMDEGLLTVQAHGTRRTFRAVDTDSLRLYLQSNYEELRHIGDDHALAYGTRAVQASATGNSKLVKVRSCPGFPVNCYQPLTCMLRGKRFFLNPAEGSFIFIDDWQSFIIPADVIVLGIENMENFRMIRRQRALFGSCLGDSRLLFVSRYPQSTDLRTWLQAIPNRYVHFGDFDLAGIHIFLTEFHAFIGQRASFLIPPDISHRLATGSPSRYNDQYARYNGVCSTDPDLQRLIDLINTHHRAYDQEGYIDSL